MEGVKNPEDKGAVNDSIFGAQQMAFSNEPSSLADAYVFNLCSTTHSNRLDCFQFFSSLNSALCEVL